MLGFVAGGRLSTARGWRQAFAVPGFIRARVVATGQSLVPATLRASTSAVLALVGNIIGLGLGPLVTGMISDRLINYYGLGNESLRYAIAASAVVALWGAAHCLRAASFVRDELALAKDRSESAT